MVDQASLTSRTITHCTAQAWLPADHLVWFIAETVDQLDLSPILETYRDGGQGNLSYHPSMMLKILIYAYAQEATEQDRQIQDDDPLRVRRPDPCLILAGQPLPRAAPGQLPGVRTCQVMKDRQRSVPGWSR